MKICDNNCGDPSGGHTVETWASKQNSCLALRIESEHYKESGATASLTPDDCFALGMVLLNHAAANGVKLSFTIQGPRDESR